MPQPSRLAILAGFASIYLIWGSTYLAIRLGVESIPPFLMAAVRFLLAGAAFIGWARYRGGFDAPICQDSRSRSQVCGLARSVVCHHALKDLAGEKAFETADDLPFGPPFSGASFDVVEGW